MTAFTLILWTLLVAILAFASGVLLVMWFIIDTVEKDPGYWVFKLREAGHKVIMEGNDEQDE